MVFVSAYFSDLDPKIMAIFTKEDSVDAKEATQVRICLFSRQTFSQMQHFRNLELTKSSLEW